MTRQSLTRLCGGALLAATLTGCLASTQQEVELGTQYAQQINQQLPIVQDAEVNRYINVLGDSIARLADDRQLEWQFFVVNDPSINAFAVPGGYIYVNRGLIERAANLSELAGVLGHEIAHVVQKHQVKAIKGAMGRDFATEIAGEAAGRSDNVLVQRFGSKAFSVGTQVLARGIDKNDEYQADQHGVVIAARGGYNPSGLVGVLQTLDSAAPNDRAMGLLFSTHPTPSSRIERLGGTMGEKLDAYAGNAPARPLYRPK
jgi:predicted Zn-dependent protease